MHTGDLCIQHKWQPKAFACILQWAHRECKGPFIGNYINLYSVYLLISHLVNAAGLFRWWNRAGSHTWEDRPHALTHDCPRGPRCTLRALCGGHVGADLLQKFWGDSGERKLTVQRVWTKQDIHRHILPCWADWLNLFIPCWVGLLRTHKPFKWKMIR